MTHFAIAPNIRYAVIGDPVAHSKSPEMQNAGFAALGMGEPYAKIQVRPEQIGDFARFAAANLDGFNITVPHKEAIIPFLAACTPDAAAARSVNTVSCRDGKLYGGSTDGYGLETAIMECFKLSPVNKKVLFAGTGGAAHAAAFHLAGRGVTALYLANRTMTKAEMLAQELQRSFPALHIECVQLTDAEHMRRSIQDSDLLIQATSLGLRADDPVPFAPELLLKNRDICFFDTIYKETALLQYAKSSGIRCGDGRYMLLHQGCRSFEIWTGQKAPVEIMRLALERSLANHD